MYLNLVQLAESFGVSENVIEDWIRSEGLPHVPERGRLLFDRTQVANWAAARGLAAHAGFLAPASPALTTGWDIGTLLQRGGIHRELPVSQLLRTLTRLVDALPETAPAVRRLVSQRLAAPDGITVAPVGGGFALPHPSARIALGRNAGLLALLLLSEPLTAVDRPPDETPVTKLFFFVAPSPRAHLDLLGRLSRLLSVGAVREVISRRGSDREIFAAIAAADPVLSVPRQEVAR